MQQIFWASKVEEIKMLLKLRLLEHKHHQPCEMERFSESLVGSVFALCREAVLILYSVWLSPGHHLEGQKASAPGVQCSPQGRELSF